MLKRIPSLLIGLAIGSLYGALFGYLTLNFGQLFLSRLGMPRTVTLLEREALWQGLMFIVFFPLSVYLVSKKGAELGKQVAFGGIFGLLVGIVLWLFAPLAPPTFWGLAAFLFFLFISLFTNVQRLKRVMIGIMTGTASGLFSGFLTGGSGLFWGPVIGLSVFGLSFYVTRPDKKERERHFGISDLAEWYHIIVIYFGFILLCAFAFDLIVLQWFLQRTLIPWGFFVQNVLSGGSLLFVLSAFVVIGLILNSAADHEFGKRAFWCSPLLVASVYALLAVWQVIRPIDPIFPLIAVFLHSSTTGFYVLWFLALPLSVTLSYGTFLLSWYLIKNEYFWADDGTHVSPDVYRGTTYPRGDDAPWGFDDYGPRVATEKARQRQQEEWRRRRERY